MKRRNFFAAIGAALVGTKAKAQGVWFRRFSGGGSASQALYVASEKGVTFREAYMARQEWLKLNNMMNRADDLEVVSPRDFLLPFQVQGSKES